MKPAPDEQFDESSRSPVAENFANLLPAATGSPHSDSAFTVRPTLLCSALEASEHLFVPTLRRGVQDKPLGCDKEGGLGRHYVHEQEISLPEAFKMTSDALGPEFGMTKPPWPDDGLVGVEGITDARKIWCVPPNCCR